MAKAILMPQVGQDLTEGKLVELKVAVGDSVSKGDIVAVVESEKASFDVEAFESGIVLAVLYKEGDTTRVLEPILYVGQPGEVASSTPEPRDAAPALRVNLGDESTEVDAKSAPTVFSAQGSKLRSSPLARRLAGRHGLDLASIAGSGERGSIVKRDIEARLASRGDQAIVADRNAIHMRTLRDGVGDPILLLHGFGSEIGSWRAFIGHLSVANPIVALDLPGHGGSPEPADSGFGALVRAVEDALVGANLARLHLVGHSLGGAVAAALAAGGSLDVRSLTLIAPAGLGPKINGDFISGFCAAETEAGLRAWLTVLVHEPAALPGALVRATMRAREGSGIAQAQTRLAEALFPRGTQVFSIREALNAYAGPLRVIVGREDAIIPSEYTEALPPYAALHRLPRVGHLPQLEAPALVARLLMETTRGAG